MNDPVKGNGPRKKKLPARFYGWLDRRTGIRSLVRTSLDEPIPGGARLAYVFGSGLLFIFISQVITGLCLALYYVPSAETAHTSVAYITKKVAAGAFLRSLHYYGSSAMIIVLALHFLQTFLYGSFKGRREVLWISGAVLSFLVLAMGFSGYLLPWDQRAYFATAVGTNIVGQFPLIGGWITRLLLGGDTLGTLTLSRYYFAHVFLIPGMIFAFIGVHISLFRKAGPAGPINEDPVKPKLPPEGFFPRQVIMDMAFAMLIMVGLGFLAYFHPVGLGPVADPSNTLFIPRPEWYYLPMFEWLKFWEGPKTVIGIVVVPGTLALLFFLLPFWDRSLERRPWRRPIPLLAVAIVLTGMIFLGIRSHLDDLRDPTVAAQLALQDKQEKDYTAAPFHPRMEGPGGQLAVGPVSPLVAKGKGIFDAHGCSGCHGATGTGTAMAPSLVGITSKYPLPELTHLLRHPNAAMLAGHMPSFDLSTPDMKALFSYLGSLGGNTSSAPAELASAPSPAATPANSAAAAPVAKSSKEERGRTVPPANTAGASPAPVAAGEKIFQAHACFACHGQAGAGTARVPALAGLVAGKSSQQLAKLLLHPDAKMQAGGMPPFTGSPAEENSLIAYIQSLGPAKHARSTPQAGPPATAPQNQVAAAPTPPPSPAKTAAQSTPQRAPAASPSPVAEGRAVFVANGCAACHGQQGTGTHFAPSLVGITKKFPGDKLPYLIGHPTSKMRDGGMPVFHIDAADMQHLVAYLGSLGNASNGPVPAVASSAARTSAGQGQSGNANPQPGPTPKPAAPRVLSAQALAGREIFQTHSCQNCHGIDGLHGTVAAPGLAGTASILPASVLENLLRHHSIQMQRGGMPLTNMNAKDMRALVAYIRSMPNPAEGQ